jgi:hypothetical protein
MYSVLLLKCTSAVSRVSERQIGNTIDERLENSAVHKQQKFGEKIIA